MLEPVWIEFTEGVFYRVCAASPAPGRLARAHRPSVLRCRDGVLLVLSSSAGLLHTGAEAEQVLGTLADDLLLAAGADGVTDRRAALQQAVHRAYEDGRFGRGLPEVLAVVVESGRQARVWHAGPNGTGTSGAQGVRRLSTDSRYAALIRDGVTEGLGSTPDEPLLREVLGITVLEPPWFELQGFVATLDGGCILLMSKGALPFGAPFEPETPEAFWGRDGGWRHGLGFTVVAVCDRNGMDAGNRAIEALRDEVGERALAEWAPGDVPAARETLALRLLADPSPLIRARGMVMCVHWHLRALEPVVRQATASTETFAGAQGEASLAKLALAAARALNRYRGDTTFPDWASVAVEAPDVLPDQDREDDADPAYLAARQLLLSDVPADAAPGTPFAVVLESGLPTDTYTLVVSTDGSVSSYRSNGLAERGLGLHATVRAAADFVLELAADHWDDLEPTRFTPRPGDGTNLLLLLSPEEVRCTPPMTWETVGAIVADGSGVARLLHAAVGVVKAIGAVQESAGPSA